MAWNAASLKRLAAFVISKGSARASKGKSVGKPTKPGTPQPPPPNGPAPTQPLPTGTSLPGTYNSILWGHGAVLIADVDQTAADYSNHGHQISYNGVPALTQLPNGDPVCVFNGVDQYLEVADAPDLSVSNTGVLTLEAWFRPDVLNFTKSEAEGYVHWMGKGVPNQHEYAARMYNQNSARPNRVSGYAWNLSGGLGAGSYFEDPWVAGTWCHYGLVINTVDRGTDGWGTTKIFKNGVLRDTDTLGGSYYIYPANGTAPLRVGTRDLVSFFKGAIGKVAVYGYDASSHFPEHVKAMTG